MLIWKNEEGKIVVEKEEEGKDADEIINWLQKNAPECFTSDIENEGYKLEGLDKWSKKKLGIKD